MLKSIGLPDKRKEVSPLFKHMACNAALHCRRAMAEGRAGDNVGLLLRSTKKDEVQRGQVGALAVY
jgi:translation elongation factor EF-Tu-like GTPase